MALVQQDARIQRLYAHFDALGRDIGQIITSEDCDDVGQYEDMLYDIAKTYRQFSKGRSLFASVLASVGRGGGLPPPDIGASLRQIRRQGEQILGGVGRIEAHTDKIARRFKDKKRKYLNLPLESLKYAAETWIRYRYASDCVTPKKGRKISKTDVYYYKEREMLAHRLERPEDFSKAVDNARKQLPELFPELAERKSRKNLSR